MKKCSVWMIPVLILLLVSGCCGKPLHAIDFSAEDVSRIELYRYIVPVQAQGMTITERAEIENAVNAFENLRTMGKADPNQAIAGTTNMIIVFYLDNGEQVTFGYNGSVLDKRGGFQEEIGDRGIYPLWKPSRYETRSVDQNDLP